MTEAQQMVEEAISLLMQPIIRELKQRKSQRNHSSQFVNRMGSMVSQAGNAFLIRIGTKP
jgi:hypothetical protein